MELRITGHKLLARMRAIRTRIAILKWISYLAILNAVAGLLVAAYFGGVPDFKDGRFYVNSHGSLREITENLYTYLWWYEQFVMTFTVIGIISFYWWQR